MSLNAIKKMLVGLSMLACTTAFATPLTVDVSGIQSFGTVGNAGNTVLLFDVGAFSSITAVSYDINITAYSPSWLSEIGLQFTDLGLTEGVALLPGVNYSSPGTRSFADSVDLISAGLDFSVGADGVLRLEFYESFNDVAGVDGIWNFGTVTFEIAGYNPVDPVDPVDPQPVPEPASALLLAAGLGLMRYAGRRRATH